MAAILAWLPFEAAAYRTNVCTFDAAEVLTKQHGYPPFSEQE
jgi:hypothetical protein